MGRLIERVTGSVVNVADEDEAAVLAFGLYDPVKDAKAPAKKSASAKKK